MNRKLIRGKLFVKNPKALNDPNIGHTLFRDMSRHDIRNLMVWDSNWAEKGIEFNREHVVHKGREDALTFISNLQKVMKLPAATELKLTGEFKVTIQTDTEPHNFRVYVENGKVSYKEASYVWSETMTP